MIALPPTSSPPLSSPLVSRNPLNWIHNLLIDQFGKQNNTSYTGKESERLCLHRKGTLGWGRNVDLAAWRLKVYSCWTSTMHRLESRVRALGQAVCVWTSSPPQLTVVCTWANYWTPSCFNFCILHMEHSEKLPSRVMISIWWVDIGKVLRTVPVPGC